MRNMGAAFAAVALVLSMSRWSAATDVAEPRHLIYLHGRIIQEWQDPRPQHPEFGYYELEKILDAFRIRGFVVSGEMRSKEESVSEAAEHVVKQVRSLLDSGVPADHVMVVGASMGAGIALVASARLQDPDIGLAVLGTCLSDNVSRILAQEGKGPSGRVLSIREASDSVTSSCPFWKEGPESSSRLHGREMVLETGLDHGFLYRPLPEWVHPVAEWGKVSRAP